MQRNVPDNERPANNANADARRPTRPADTCAIANAGPIADAAANTGAAKRPVCVFVGATVRNVCFVVARMCFLSASQRQRRREMR